MQHLAIDLGGKGSQICVRDATEKILEERKYPTRRLGEDLAKRLSEPGDPGDIGGGVRSAIASAVIRGWRALAGYSVHRISASLPSAWMWPTLRDLRDTM